MLHVCDTYGGTLLVITCTSTSLTVEKYLGDDESAALCLALVLVNLLLYRKSALLSILDVRVN